MYYCEALSLYLYSFVCMSSVHVYSFVIFETVEFMSSRDWRDSEYWLFG